jgi:hypothetical protein
MFNRTLLILSFICLISLNIFGQEVKRSPELKKDYANVFYNTSYTLFDFYSDEPIFPDKSGKYDIIISSNENKSAQRFLGSGIELSKLLMFKFKSIETHRKWAQGDIVPMAKSESITKKSENKWDLGCIANFTKRIGFPTVYLSSKNSILGNSYEEAMASGEKIAFVSVIIEVNKISKGLLFNDYGGVRVVKRNSEKKPEIEYEGEWTCINSNNVKLNARSLVNKNEVLYFDTESMEMESKFDTPENVKRNDSPVTKAETMEEILAC